MNALLTWLKALLRGGEPVLAEAALRDVGAIALLHAASFRRGWSEDEIERMLLDRNVLTHCAKIGGAFAGFIMSRRAAGEAEILSVAVMARRKSRGLARAMLRLHLGRLAALGVRAVFLEVDENNQPALRLYRRAGFREVGRRKDYYPGQRGADALVLRRELV